MKILITGNKGFIGRNLTEALSGKLGIEIFPFDKDSDDSLLEEYTGECDFVYHLAAVHRPPVASEFNKVNRIFFEYVLASLQKNDNPCPVLLTSSTHAGPDSEYGRSKLAAEEALKKHTERMDSRAIIYRLTNTFGRYALPNHHSVVANFCYNAAQNMPVVVNEPERMMLFYYIDDVIASFLTHLDKKVEPDNDGYFRLSENLIYPVKLNKLATIVNHFKLMNDQNQVPELTDEFSRKLYQTFQFYLQDEKKYVYDGQSE
jgi:UDP-2-acetamido-2,6-beta-L-arabino-hexul-4-ose reductase